MEWTTAASFTARIGVLSYQKRHLAQEWWQKARVYLDKGSTEILVTGRPNVGKTVLVSQMLGEARGLYYELPRESRTVEVEAITLGDWTKLIRTLPGQSSLVRTTGVNDTFDENPELSGVIHVVDFGYTIPRDPTLTQSLIKDDKLTTLEYLRKYNLENEIDELKNLIVSIERSYAKQQTPKWLVIAVNKVDLFKEQLNEALLFYHPNGSSAFSKELNKLIKKLGTNSLSVYVLSTCSYEQDFEWNLEERKSLLAIQEQRAIVREFMETVTSITES